MLPAAAGLIPHIEKRIDLNDPNIIYTILALDSPTVKFPDDVKEGETLQISGHLYQVNRTYIEHINDLVMADASKTGVLYLDQFEKLLRDSLTTAGALTPLSARTVNVYTEYSNVFRQYDVLNVITDQDGYFRTTMQIDNLSHWNKFIAAFYKGEKQRITSRIQITYMPSFVYLPPQDGGSPPYPIDLGGSGLKAILNVYVIPIVLNSFAGILSAVVAWFIYRYRKQIRGWLKRRKAQGALPEKVSVKTKTAVQQTVTPEQVVVEAPAISNAASTLAVREVSAGDPRVEILFPQIENPLPPVWGIGEPLTISSRVPVDKAEGEVKFQPQIETRENGIDITMSGFSQVQVEHVFDKKGETYITVHFSGDKVFGTRKIRIVDYREEIVALFNHLIDSLSAKDIPVDRMMTAREIEMKLKEQNPDIAEDTINDIVNGFEAANYSLHPVARKIYIDMYLAVEKIRERVENA